MPETTERGNGHYQPFVRTQTRPEHLHIHRLPCKTLYEKVAHLSRFSKRFCVCHRHHSSDVQSLQRTLGNTNTARFLLTRMPRLADTRGISHPLPHGEHSPCITHSDVPSLQHTPFHANTTTPTIRFKHLPARTSTAWRNIARCEAIVRPCTKPVPAAAAI